MADHHNHNYTKSISSFLISPKLRAMAAKGLFGDSENSCYKTPKSNTEPGGIGLAMIDTIIDDPVREIEKGTKPRNGEVLFGSKLRVQIPDLVESSVLGPEKNSSEFLSLSEMELSEDYTCVINHGPNPKTTHIIYDCVFESVFSENFRFNVKNLKSKENYGKIMGMSVQDLYFHHGLLKIFLRKSHIEFFETDQNQNRFGDISTN